MRRIIICFICALAMAAIFMMPAAVAQNGQNDTQSIKVLRIGLMNSRPGNNSDIYGNNQTHNIEGYVNIKPIYRMSLPGSIGAKPIFNASQSFKPFYNANSYSRIKPIYEAPSSIRSRPVYNISGYPKIKALNSIP